VKRAWSLGRFSGPPPAKQGCRRQAIKNNVWDPDQVDLREALFAVASGPKQDHVAPVLRFQRAGEGEHT
jgi:hypothetical protein